MDQPGGFLVLGEVAIHGSERKRPKEKNEKMKKLMIAAAAAVMIGGAQAMVCAKDSCGGDAAGTAYKVAISLKTTDTKSKTKVNKCASDNCVAWRQQVTKKINGLLWEALSDCTGCYTFSDSTLAAFWTNTGAVDADFAIGVGLIGNATNSKKIEAYGGLNGADFGALSWGGFGTMAGATRKASKCDECGTCVMYPKSITGGIAGYLIPEGFNSPCGDTCDDIVYDGCCDDLKLAGTAAYGTIKITYDAATAKKVAIAGTGAPITSFYKIPAAAAAGIDDATKEITIEE